MHGRHGNTWARLLVIAGICTIVQMPAAAHPSADASIEAACRSLVLDYAYFRDRYDADGYADLFAEDAVLSVLGVDYQGRAAIKARLLEDTAQPLSRHHMSTIKILPVDANTATGVSYVTVYVEPSTGQLPVTTEGFTAIGEYHDTFVRTDAGWKIARREFKPALLLPAKQ